MTGSPPPIDARTAPEIERQLVSLIRTYAPTWNETDPATGRATGMSAGLIGVAARFAELTLQRLNRAPEKNQLAFLDLIGAAPLPALPARVPLTFALAAGARGATVPAGTQVAAPPGPDRAVPVVFETQRDLAITPATLARVVTWDAPADRRSDHDRLADPGNATPAILFAGDGPLEHAIYFGQAELLGYPTITGCGLSITLMSDLPTPPDPRAVQWEVCDGKDGIPLTPVSVDGSLPDSTAALTQSGFVGFGDIGQVPLTTVAGVTSRWLRCRLLTPITASDDPVAGFVRAAHLPKIGDTLIQGTGRAPPIQPDAAFLNAIPLDVSKDFQPFGPEPKFGATLYLASRAVLSQTGRRITLVLSLTDESSGIPHPGASANLAFDWEYWTDRGWTDIGTTTPAGTIPVGTSYLSDTGPVFTDTGQVSFVLQTPPRATVVNGIESYWLRVRMTGGMFMPRGVSPAAPSVARATLAFDSTASGFNFQAASHIVQEDAMTARQCRRFGGYETGGFAPAGDPGRSLYLGLAIPDGGMPARPLSLWAEVEPVPAGTHPDAPLASTRPRLAWSYWNGAGWAPVTVADETGAFTGSGEIRLIPPADLTPAGLFRSGPLGWLRASWAGGDYKFLPRLRRLLLDTTLGEQATTVRAETLGTSDGQPRQRFTAAQSPILAGVALDVAEPEWPSAIEQSAIVAAAGPDAITARAGGGVAVRWSEVGDFHASGPRDRHFLVDHATGAIRFGDGAAGLIPPRGAGLMLAAYRTGGGAVDDVAAGAIDQLKTTLPYVAGVTNRVAAAGGVAAESLDAMRARAPRLIRHGGRAVTAEDFEDLARLASPEVARTRCVPLHDLSVDPDGATRRPGVVSVLIVPRSSTPAPIPGVDLIERVGDYLAARTLAALSVVVVGPEYVTVDVRVQVSVVRLEDAGPVEIAVRAAIAAFLHPLTGGADGLGWDFGRRPHRSDLFTLLQRIDGVDHLRGVTVTETPARPGTIDTGRFLVCSGRHRVDLSFGSL